MPTPLELLEAKKLKAEKALEEKGKNKQFSVYVGMATCEIAAGSKDAMAVFEQSLSEGADFYLSQKGCAGRCSVEPTVEVYEKGKAPVLYSKVNAEKAKKIVNEHIKQGKPVVDL